MNDKEKLFCRYYLLTGNPREAAARAGYRLMPERWGLKLLERESVQAFLKKEKAKNALPDVGISGLKRMAFCNIADAIRLLFLEVPPPQEELEAMDLYMISEIKRPKGGGMEIKFYDRLKAMELLCQYAQQEQKDVAVPFYQALSEGAARLKGEEKS